MNVRTLVHPSADHHAGRAMRPHLWRTLSASGWMYSSRLLVFGWALLLIHTVGIASYGTYAMAFAAGAVIGVPLDGYFTARGPRVTREVFLRERSTRAIFGFTLMMVGVALWPLNFLAGFAVLKAGSDVAFQASRSSLIRDGRPDHAQRADAVRQVVGMACGTAYLLIAGPEAEMPIAAALFLAGSALPIILGLQALTHARPSLPQMDRSSALILGESLGGVGYVHAEVLLLGLLGSPTSAGYYSFAATLLWSLAALGQSFGTTFHQKLRDSRGDIASGPPLRTAFWLSVTTAAVIGSLALALWLLGFPEEIWLILAILTPVSFLRTLSSVATVVLVLQHRDRFRLVVTAISVAVKVGLVLVLAEYGGPGAALAFLVSDCIMSGSYAFAVYGGRGRVPARA